MCTLIKNFEVILIFSFLLAFFTPAKSTDCPDDIYPENDPWTEECDTVLVHWGPGQNCLWEVCYCWRIKNYVPAPYVDIFFRYGNYVSGDCSGDPMDAWEVIRLLTEYLIQQNPGNLDWPCLACPSTLWSYRGLWASCYNDVTGQSCGSAGYCMFKYKVCCENGVRIVTFDTSEKIGDDCPSGCSDHCNTP